MAQTIDQPFVIDGEQVRVGASVGVARSAEPSDEGVTGDDLLRRADLEMYAAKALSERSERSERSTRRAGTAAVVKARRLRLV